MQKNYLTKSDFKAARACPTKLYYRKMGYPTRDDRNEYIGMLADEGYRVEALARTLFPEGRRIGYQADVESAARETLAALRDDCTLFEATFISAGKLARADILIRRGQVFELIEIKTCGFDRQENDRRLQDGRPNIFRSSRIPQAVRSEWRPYLEDAAFQVCVLEEIFRDASIIPYLLMMDTSRPVTLGGLHHCFALRSDPRAEGLMQESSLSADFTGDPRDFHRNPFLAQVNVAEEVHTLMPEVRNLAESYRATLLPSLRRVPTPLSADCARCEYRVADSDLNGFRECWGELSDVTPHILDLYHAKSLGRREEPLVNQLLAQGKAGLYDIPEEQLARRDGSVGEVAQRQRRQIHYTRENREWVSEELGSVLDRLSYPLYFVDFETCAPTIPRYEGMRPFETIAFQWCCQTVSAPEAPPLHTDWLQTADSFPNKEFALTLRRQVSDSGSILVWANHEETILKKIRSQLVERGEGETDLAMWLDEIVRSGRLVDMNQLTLKHYFHPRMRGSTSLKIVAEAVWGSNPTIRARLPRYLSADGDHATSPYRALPPIPIGDRMVSVAEGTGAIMAYYTMMERAAAKATPEAEHWRQLLLQYCQLDTLAMVMVWWHWRELTGKLK